MTINSATYTVNNNAGKVWYGMRDLGDNTKLRLHGVSRYIQNCGVQLTQEEVDTMKAEVDKVIAQFTKELTDIKAEIDNCLDRG